MCSYCGLDLTRTTYGVQEKKLGVTAGHAHMHMHMHMSHAHDMSHAHVHAHVHMYMSCACACHVHVHVSGHMHVHVSGMVRIASYLRATPPPPSYRWLRRAAGETGRRGGGEAFFFRCTILVLNIVHIRILDPCGLAAIISRSRAESTEFETSWGRAAPPCNQAALREMKGC